MLLNSCKPIEKAKQRVLTNPEAFNFIGEKWAYVNPCNKEKPEPIYIKGRDVPILYPVIDTTKLKALRDSINASKIDLNGYCDNYVDAAYKAGYDNAIHDYKQPVRVDTFKVPTPPDTRNENILKGQVAAITSERDVLKGKLESSEAESTKLGKWLFYLIIIALALGITIGKFLPTFALPKIPKL